jgi:xylulokinase
MCGEIGLDPDHYPEILDCHAVAGEVTAAAADECGLIAGTPVIIGGVDAAVATLGAGVCSPGQTQEQGGTSGGMSICMDSPAYDSRLILTNHVIPGMWLLQGGTVGGGGAMKWFAEQFGSSFGGLDGINKEAGKIPPGSGGVIFQPYLSGERSPIWDADAKGIFHGLSFSTTKAHMARAVMEGVAFSLRHNLETAESAGAVMAQLYAVGGSANSSLWTQIKADVTGFGIAVPESDNATALGAAILAGAGAGVYKDIAKSAAEIVKVKREHTPDAANSGVYDSAYERYLELYARLKGL